MSYTDRYNLQRLTTSDISENSYKFTDADRVLIDALLFLGAEAHHHTGGAAAEGAPDTGPNVTLDTSTGSLPAATRIYYKYTYVDGSGVETAASPEVYIDTPAAVAAPAAPTLGYATTGGTLQPGNYFYVLTAYDTFNNLETTADNPAYLSIPYTTATNAITITMPVLPSGATGFNIYRKGPSATGYRYLASTTGSSYVDSGSVAETQTRPTPTGNSTISTNSVELELPGATPALPGVGYYWRIYRTFVAGDYTNSLLVTTDEISYVDEGTGTTVGQPPTAGASVGSPSKILLTNGAEVQGYLPVANIEDFATEVQAAAIPAGIELLGNTDPRQVIVTAESGQSDSQLIIKDDTGYEGQTFLVTPTSSDISLYTSNTTMYSNVWANSTNNTAGFGVYDNGSSGAYAEMYVDIVNNQAELHIVAAPGQTAPFIRAYDNSNNLKFAVNADGSITSSLVASGVPYSGATDLVSTNVEAALDELDTEKLSRFGGQKHGFLNGGNSGTSHTVLLTAANSYRLILTANCTLTMPTVTAPTSGATPAAFAHEFELFLVQDATGSRTVVWPASVWWPSGVAPTLTTVPGKTDRLRFVTHDNGVVWYGEVVGQNY